LRKRAENRKDDGEKDFAKYTDACKDQGAKKVYAIFEPLKFWFIAALRVLAQV
jgi:hypothetical protein